MVFCSFATVDFSAFSFFDKTLGNFLTVRASFYAVVAIFFSVLV